MATPSTRRNEHPVDRIAELRAQQKAIEAEVEALREQVLSGEVGLVGEWHVARVDTQKRSVLSRDLLEKRFGAKAIAECCETREMRILKTFAKK